MDLTWIRHTLDKNKGWYYFGPPKERYIKAMSNKIIPGKWIQPTFDTRNFVWHKI